MFSHWYFIRDTRLTILTSKELRYKLSPLLFLSSNHRSEPFLYLVASLWECFSSKGLVVPVALRSNWIIRRHIVISSHGAKSSVHHELYVTVVSRSRHVTHRQPWRYLIVFCDLSFHPFRECLVISLGLLLRRRMIKTWIKIATFCSLFVNFVPLCPWLP